MFRSFTIKPSSGLTSTSSNSHLILTSLRFQISSTGTYDPDNEPEHSTITERTPPLNLHTNPHEDQGHKNLSRLHGIETFPPPPAREQTTPWTDSLQHLVNNRDIDQIYQRHITPNPTPPVSHKCFCIRATPTPHTSEPLHPHQTVHIIPTLLIYILCVYVFCILCILHFILQLKPFMYFIGKPHSLQATDVTKARTVYCYHIRPMALGHLPTRFTL